MNQVIPVRLAIPPRWLSYIFIWREFIRSSVCYKVNKNVHILLSWPRLKQTYKPEGNFPWSTVGNPYLGFAGSSATAIYWDLLKLEHISTSSMGASASTANLPRICRNENSSAYSKKYNTISSVITNQRIVSTCIPEVTCIAEILVEENVSNDRCLLKLTCQC